MKNCCICKRPFAGHGNNPEPVKKWSDGACCFKCNCTVVLPARLDLIRNAK